MRKMFKHSAYTKATTERRELLTDIGRKYTERDDNTIFCIGLDGGKSQLHCCLQNPNLFDALVAINDENDDMQWFICGEENDSMFLCTYNNVQEHIHNELDGWDTSNYRKATKDELINHFKTK